MSRETSLVDADWVAEHLDDPSVVLVEVDEDTSAYTRGHIPGAVRVDWRDDLQDPVRRDFVSREQFESLMSARGIGNDAHRGAVRRQQQLVRGLRLLVLHALRARATCGCSTAAARSGSSTAASWTPRCRSGRRRRTPRRSRTPRCGRCATRCSPRSASATWSTCAPPTSSPAGCSRRPTCRRSSRSGPGTSRPRGTSRGARPPATTGRSATTRSCAELYADEGVDFERDTIAYCRIGERSAHTWFVLHEILEQPNVKNYDGSWTEWGSLVGVPIALGEEPGVLA